MVIHRCGIAVCPCCFHFFLHTRAKLSVRNHRIMASSITRRKEWQFFSVLPKADRLLASVWWVVLVLRGVLPAAFAIVMGALVSAVQGGGSLRGPLAAAGVVFVLLQVLPPVHTAVGWNLGDRTAAWLYDRLTEAGVGPPASKELRLFGLAGWTLDRFIAHRTTLHKLQYEATRLRERPVIWSLLIVVAANVVVFWALASAAATGRLTTGALVVYAQCAVGVSLIAFGGFSWALDGASAPVAAVLRLERSMAPKGALSSGRRDPTAFPRRDIRFRNVRFAYDGSREQPVLDGFDLTIPAGSSLASVGQHGAVKPRSSSASLPRRVTVRRSSSRIASRRSASPTASAC